MVHGRSALFISVLGGLMLGGGVGARSRPAPPAPAPPVARADGSSPALSLPPRAHVRLPRRPAVPDWTEESVEALRDRVAELQTEWEGLLEAGGYRPPDWLQDFPPEHRAEAVKAALARSIPGWPPTVSLAHVDCPPEPCVITLRMDLEELEEGEGSPSMEDEDAEQLGRAKAALKSRLGFAGHGDRSSYFAPSAEGGSGYVHLSTLWWFPPEFTDPDLRQDVRFVTGPRASRAQEAWMRRNDAGRAY